MVSFRTTIILDTHNFSNFNHLDAAKKTAKLATTPLHLYPNITAWLNRARYSDGNRCDGSRNVRAELRLSFAKSSSKLFQDNIHCDRDWDTFLIFFDNLLVHLYDCSSEH